MSNLVVKKMKAQHLNMDSIILRIVVSKKRKTLCMFVLHKSKSCLQFNTKKETLQETLKFVNDPKNLPFSYIVGSMCSNA